MCDGNTYVVSRCRRGDWWKRWIPTSNFTPTPLLYLLMIGVKIQNSLKGPIYYSGAVKLLSFPFITPLHVSALRY